MKNKKYLISILVYIGLLASVILAFVLITNIQQNNSYETVLMASDDFSRTEQIYISETNYTKYIKQAKIPKDTILEMKEAGATPVTSKAEIEGKYSIGFIPKGTILTTKMFDSKITTDTGFYAKNDYENGTYIVLKANKTNAPVNGFKKGINISIQNIEAIVSENIDGTQEKNYGTLVNKAEVYNTFYDENNNVTNVGIICEAEDAKKLITLEDLGTTFRYVEGKLDLTTWTENDIINEYNIKNMNNNELLYYSYTSAPTIEEAYYNSKLLENAEYTENNFGYVPEIQTNNNVIISLRGLYEPSQIVLAKYGLNGGIEKNNRIFTQNSEFNTSYIKLESPNPLNPTNEGYYEIKINTSNGVKMYHFIIENDKDNDGTYYEENLYDKYFNVLLTDSLMGSIQGFDSSIYAEKDYYKTCIGLSTHNYKKQISLNTSTIDKDGNVTPVTSFLISQNIGSYSGIKIENIYLKKDVSEDGSEIKFEYPIYFRGIEGKTSLSYDKLDDEKTNYVKYEATLWYNLSKYNALKTTFTEIQDEYKDFYTNFVTNNYTDMTRNAYLVLENNSYIEIILNFVAI